MIQIDNTLISLDVFEKKFACDLKKCHGSCCLEGDSGAPLEEEETHILDEICHLVKPYLTMEGLESLEQNGTWLIDSDGDKVTPLIDGKECAYSYQENGIFLCAIEKAYFEKKISFRKPVSCHLYPIRITKYKDFDAVNYNQWDICAPARIRGDRDNIPVYRFVKDALIRKYGPDWYEQLEIAYKELYNSK